MTKRTAAEIYDAARTAGLSSASALIATAVALAESSGNDVAVGDTAITTNTWGPSVGLWQIRTLKSETGTGSDRDINALQGNVARQAQAMRHISSDGTNWTPWSVFTSGKYTAFLGQAQAAVGGGVSMPTLTSVANPATDALNAAVPEARKLLLKLAVAGLGLALVGAGVWQAVAPKVGKAVSGVTDTATKVAKVAAL